MTNNKEPKLLTPDNVARAVMMLFGKMSNQQPFWCFVAVKPSRRAELAQKIKDKTFEITRYVEDGYGEIIVSGESQFPPREVLKKLSEMFNMPIRQFFANIDFDAEVTKEIEILKKELGDI